MINLAHLRQSIGKENAITLFNSGWWKTKTPQEIVRFQLFTNELAMPFSDFHGAMEACLNRGVFTHEFGVNYDGLAREFLGESPAPSLEEILNLIPADKRVILQLP